MHYFYRDGFAVLDIAEHLPTLICADIHVIQHSKQRHVIKACCAVESVPPLGSKRKEQIESRLVFGPQLNIF